MKEDKTLRGGDGWSRPQPTDLMVVEARRAWSDGSDVSDGSEAPSLPVSSSPGLRLWLPEVHTLSLNRTKGRHWSQSYRARKGEAAALLEALGQVAESAWPGMAMLREGCRVLGLLALGQDVRKIRLPVFPRPTQRLEIVYTRVTVKPLDAENWCGSTKGMTDCLKYAFPGLLPDDAPEFVEIVHRQVRVRRKCEEGTWVELRLVES